MFISTVASIVAFSVNLIAVLTDLSHLAKSLNVRATDASATVRMQRCDNYWPHSTTCRRLLRTVRGVACSSSDIQQTCSATSRQHRDGHGLGPSTGRVGSHFLAHVTGLVGWAE